MDSLHKRPNAGGKSGLFSAKGRAFLVQSFRTPWWHKAVERLIAVTALTAIFAVILIFTFVGKEALPILWDPEFRGVIDLRDLVLPKLWSGYTEPVMVWQPVGKIPKYNMIPLFVGTFKTTFLAMVVSTPIAIGCAIFLSQYASKKMRETLKPMIELLAGVPSVVLGFFALMVLASWVQDTFGFTYRLNAVVAALGLSLAVIPLIFTISEDAMQAVPKSLTEASLALGAHKWQTTLFIVLPAALPGIAAAVILGFGRAIGETMIVLMASGNAAVTEFWNWGAGARTITATIAAELGEVPRGSPHWRVLFLLGVLLFLITFVLNWVGAHVVHQLHGKLTASKDRR